MSKATKLVTVTLAVERVERLKLQAEKEGIPLPTYCRILLSRAADQNEEIKEAA